MHVRSGILRALLMVLVVICGSAVPALLPIAASTAGAVSPTWQTSTAYPYSARPDAVSCPTTTTCLAVGADATDDVLISQDGGHTWTHQTTLPGPAGALNAIACTSTLDCIVVGEEPGWYAEIFDTNDGGATWYGGLDPDLSLGAKLTGVACMSGLNCIIVGVSSFQGVVLQVNNGDWWGGSEGAPNVPSNEGSFNAVSCPSTSDCFIVGDNGVLASTDSGDSWSVQSTPGLSATLQSIECTSSSQCIAVGEAGVIFSTSDGGVTWISEVVPSDVSDLLGVACQSATKSSDCLAVGNYSNGTTLSPVVIGTPDNGSTWTSMGSPNTNGALDGVACPDLAQCVVVGGSPIGTIATTSDGGQTWTNASLPFGLNDLYGIACPSTTTCYAVGSGDDSSAAIVGTTDGGSTWTVQSLPTGVTSLDGIACPSQTQCSAVGTDADFNAVIVSTSDGGTTWTSQAPPPGAGELAAISCPSSLDCYAVGTNNNSPSTNADVIATTDGGVTWSTDVVSGYQANLRSISCASTMNCQVVGYDANGQVLTTSDGGISWSFENLPTSTVPAAVSCPTVSNCFVLGANDVAGSGAPVTIDSTTDGGLQWSPDPVPAGTPISFPQSSGSPSSGITCTSVSDCIIVVGQGHGVVLSTRNGGAAWMNESTPTDTGPLNGVACPSSATCFAVGQGASSPDEGGLVLNGSDLDAGLAVSTPSLPSGAIGHAYSATLTADGGTAPFTWSIGSGSLPAGLSLDPQTGVIYGTPTTSETSTFTVDVADSSPAQETASASFSIRIPLPLVITTTSLPGGIIGQAYSYQVAADGGTAPVTWSIGSGSLPAGLSLNTQGGVISGTPTTSGTSTFTVELADSAAVQQTASASLSITISPTTVKITTTSLPGGSVGTKYSATLHTSGGNAPYYWFLTSGGVPGGLTLDRTTGVISGTPTNPFSQPFTVKVNDSSSPVQTATTTLRITIKVLPLVITTSTLPSGVVSSPYAQTLKASGGYPGYTWKLATGSGPLPPGLKVAGLQGKIYGTPTKKGIFHFMVSATDTKSHTVTKALSITVT